MSQKHLKEGDALPQFGGKLRLFSMRFCPFAHHATLALNAKNLEYDKVFINLESKPKWFFDINPLGSVPALELEPGVYVSGSTIISAYLDEKYPQAPLQHRDPLRRAHDKMFVEQLQQLTNSYMTAAYSPNDVTDDTKASFFKGLDQLQKELLKRGSKFLHGGEPGMVDYMLWPWLERIEMLPHLGQTDFTIDKAKYETLVSYMDNMKQSPAVKPYLLDPETHAKFTLTRRKGTPDFNMLVGSGDAACGYKPKSKK